ncbi:MAG TPA: 2-amino-4-hydroxy-6-hydroxymethyldihydropteridine diphosphokinase [Verrucomicrobiota bacterium]|nr:2-amino-4-hydroxy-6-hydroxymethyldihydropteridine diphosphokinase [Verrucomicrobiales bacterium]HRI13640.1 2-amino-4-hydroxy-6-hydroxymethyldihydropteridine diphosphokinase [Verrucomicrobiota bacterium]
MPIPKPTRAEPAVFIALGANLGDPREQIRAAIRKLRESFRGALRASSLWESTPEHCPPGSPPFVNAVVEGVPHADDSPEQMLDRLQALEREFGRRPKKLLNEARPLDLDLITWGDEQRNSSKLVLPHPRAHERRFVLVPLHELAPELRFPGQTRTVTELVTALPPDPAFRCLGPV